jgi:hypothetical protein
MITFYLLQGVIWLWYLEWYTTNRLPEPYNKPWTWRQRAYHGLLWPLSLGTWVLGLIAVLFGGDDEDDSTND